MMQLIPIDDTNRVFHVVGVLPQDLVDKLLVLDWNNLNWNLQNQQEMWARRSLCREEYPVLEEASNHLVKLQPVLEQQLGIKFDFDINVGNTNWWVDQPGFSVPIHTDGELPVSLQLFWVGQPNLATSFHNFGLANNYRAKFEFVPNTGYLMLNGPNADGSQPLNWHGMLNKVPNGTYRVTSYTVFPNYSHK
jgi:hypothetical protein